MSVSVDIDFLGWNRFVFQVGDDVLSSCQRQVIVKLICVMF